MPVSISMLTGTVRVAESPQTFRRNVLQSIARFDNKNRADITVGPVVKSHRFKSVTTSCEPLRRQLADPRRPVRERRAFARPMACATARPEQIVSGSAHEERAAPVGVGARVVDVLA